jgi:hypothetical protein
MENHTTQIIRDCDVAEEHTAIIFGSQHGRPNDLRSYGNVCYTYCIGYAFTRLTTFWDEAKVKVFKALYIYITFLLFVKNRKKVYIVK